MRASISLGRWFGIPIGLHYSWFIIAWLIMLSLAARFNALHPGWSGSTIWALAAITALLFFVSLLLHELSHALVARSYGMPVRGITLFALGGVAQIERDAASPSKEFWIAIVGPAASVVIGLLCRIGAGAAGLSESSEAATSPVASVLGWLAYINVALALFNLVPAFPLDGGRVLRSILWGATQSLERATRAAARTGQAIAFLMIGFGIYSLLVMGDVGGLWIAFIGWFLLEAAGSYAAQTEMTRALRGIRAADVMMRECATVDAGQTLQQFVDDQLLRHASRCFVVSAGRGVVGLLGPDDVRKVPRDRWATTEVQEVMRPLPALHPVTPDTSAAEVLAVMGSEHLNQVPVVQNGRVEGVVTLGYLIQLVQLRRELLA